MASSSKSSLPELFHPQGSFKFPKHKFGSTKRSFRVTWCEDYSWLHYDKASDSAFCHLYMRAVSEEKRFASNKRNPVIINSGYTYWKEAITTFKRDQTNACHREAMKLLLCYLSRFTVI